jgi:DNA-binding winged helix-turn-helix (wHTH) protein
MVSYEFGQFILCPREQQLLSDGVPVPLTYKAFETLRILLSNNGNLVEKSEIMSAVWKDSLVKDANLSLTICMIRKALGDTSKHPKYIETVFNRGYRFIAPARLC